MISFTSLSNLGSSVPWGLWVSIYAWLIGISAGAGIITAIVLLMKKNDSQYIGHLGIILSFCTMAAATICINLDLGHIERGLTMMFAITNTSPMAWAFRLYALYFIILAGMIFTIKNKIPVLLLFGAILIPLAIIIVESLLFALPPGKHWHNPVIPLLFLSSSLASGCAAIIFSGASLLPSAKKQSVLKLGTLAVVLFIANVLVEVVDGFTSKTFSSPLFILGLAGQVAAIFALRSATLSTFTNGALIGIVSSLICKYQLVISSQLHEPFKGFAAAYSESRLHFAYFPSFFEIFTSVFCVILAAGLLTFLYKHFALTRENAQ